jgi:oligoribonuclease
MCAWVSGYAGDGSYDTIRPLKIPWKIMAQDANALIWIDLEMSGLNPDQDRIIEVAVVVTDTQLDTVAEGPVFAVHQSDAILDGMDAWNKSTHARTGLTERVRCSALGEADVEGVSPMCGNSVCQDRRFLARYMPELEAYFHYRNLDVSTLKELARRWKPSIVSGFAKQGKHEALADIYESIAELRYYREHLLQL